jgi:hypothetical protein
MSIKIHCRVISKDTISNIIPFVIITVATVTVTIFFYIERKFNSR